MVILRPRAASNGFDFLFTLQFRFKSNNEYNVVKDIRNFYMTYPEKEQEAIILILGYNKNILF